VESDQARECPPARDTGAPGRINWDIPIKLPYPRTHKIKTTAAFVALKERLTEEIRA
jgi:hypothetical protein